MQAQSKSPTTIASPEDDALLEGMVAAALTAGAEVMAIYAHDFSVDAKDDASPVTEADRRAEIIILEALARIAPGVPVVAEEACCGGVIPDVGRRFFLVDPVDGTREFVSRNGEFTVNIALIEARVPIAGVVYAPARDVLFAGRLGAGAEEMRIEGGRIAERRAIAAAPPSAPLRIVASRSHRTSQTDDFIQRYPGASIVPAGSSLKFCLIASGRADLYPRFGPTMQWDTAAGDAVLRAAGGMVVTPDGEPMTYGPKSDGGLDAYKNPSFVAGSRLDICIDD